MLPLFRISVVPPHNVINLFPNKRVSKCKGFHNMAKTFCSNWVQLSPIIGHVMRVKHFAWIYTVNPYPPCNGGRISAFPSLYTWESISHLLRSNGLDRNGYFLHHMTCRHLMAISQSGARWHPRNWSREWSHVVSTEKLHQVMLKKLY